MRGIKLGEMKKFRKMKKNIDKGLPAFGKLLDDTLRTTNYCSGAFAPCEIWTSIKQ